MVRRPESTPATTLKVRPRGLPSATRGAPSATLVESPNSRTGGALPEGASSRSRARSASRSTASTARILRVPPAESSRTKSRPSPMTWWFVTARSGRTRKPVPRDWNFPSRPCERTAKSDGFAMRASFSVTMSAGASAPQMVRTNQAIMVFAPVRFRLPS